MNIISLNEKTFTVESPIEWVKEKIRSSFPKLNEMELETISANVHDAIDSYIFSNSSLSINNENLWPYLQALNPKISSYITIYRGMSVYIKDNIELIKKFDENPKNKIDNKNVSSWTFNKNMAYEYAYLNKNLATENYELVLKTNAKKDDILLMVRYLPRFYQNFIKEAEIILKPGVYSVEKINIDNINKEKINTFVLSDIHKESYNKILKSGHSYKDIINNETILAKRFISYLIKSLPYTIKISSVNDGPISDYLDLRNIKISKGMNFVFAEKENAFFNKINLEIINLNIDLNKPYHKIIFRTSNKFQIDQEVYNRMVEKIKKFLNTKKPDWEFDVRVIDGEKNNVTRTNF